MALQSRGFEVTNIPRAQGIDFSLQPGQFAAGLNSGIGAYNAFSNIAEEVRDRPLRQRERESRLAQIEAEAQLAPVRRQLTEIQLAKAGLPEEVVTGSTVVRVPREGFADQYDLVEQVDGFTFDPTTGQRTPFKRAGKMVTSAEEIADRAMRRNAEAERIAASREEIQASAASRAEANRIKNEQLALAQRKFEAAEKQYAIDAQSKGLTATRGTDENGNLVVMYTHPQRGLVATLGADAQIRPVQKASIFDQLLSGSAPSTAPNAAAPVSPAPTLPAAPQAKPISIGVLDSVDDDGNEIVTESATTSVGPFPAIPANTLSTSKGYKIIPR